MVDAIVRRRWAGRDRVQTDAEKAGSYWFSPDTLRFFQSRIARDAHLITVNLPGAPTVGTSAYPDPDRSDREVGRFYVLTSSERQWGDHPRLYTARVFYFAEIIGDERGPLGSVWSDTDGWHKGRVYHTWWCAGGDVDERLGFQRYNTHSGAARAVVKVADDIEKNAVRWLGAVPDSYRHPDTPLG